MSMRCSHPAGSGSDDEDPPLPAAGAAPGAPAGGGGPLGLLVVVVAAVMKGKHMVDLIKTRCAFQHKRIICVHSVNSKFTQLCIKDTKLLITCFFLYP